MWLLGNVEQWELVMVVAATGVGEAGYSSVRREEGRRGWYGSGGLGRSRGVTATGRLIGV